MEIDDLVQALSDPAAYPHQSDDLVVHHTHISVVFLAGPKAYKVKKPLDLGFLDFTTLARRRHFCLEEVRLNARLAPGVYEGVVPILASGTAASVHPATRRDPGLSVGAEPISPEEDVASGTVAPDGGPGVVEYAVRMERLPDEATLESRLARDEVDPELLAELARRIARFHASAASGDRVAACGRLEVVAANCRENFEQSAAQVGVTVSGPVLARLRELTEEGLARLGPQIESRARRGVPRDTHGDLRLDHVYLLHGRPPPRDLIVVDCIEFNERFRYADPVADAAFLAMDLAFSGRRDLARAFADAYGEASRDLEAAALLPFYVAYRAVVRGKVEGLEALSEDVPRHEREDALRSSRGHWLLALAAIEEPARRPCLVLVGGLPGTGKSTLARALAREAGFEVVTADAVRKELAGIAQDASATAPFGEGLYTPEWNERTYAECLRRAGSRLFDGRRVAVDASFHEEARRRAFFQAARAWGVQALLLVCEADPEVVRGRLAARTGDASDADWEIYRRAAAAWEEAGGRAGAQVVRIPAGGESRDALAAALEALRASGLLAPDERPYSEGMHRGEAG